MSSAQELIHKSHRCVCGGRKSFSIAREATAPLIGRLIEAANRRRPQKRMEGIAAALTALS
jgi:hypothetical protein